jgi:hypothetical protein
MMSPRYCAFTAFLVVALQAGGAAQDLSLPQPVGMDGDPVARIVLDGNAAFVHGDLHAAADDYRAALGRKPNFAVARFNLGLVEMHTGQSTRGLRDMDRGIDLAAAHGMTAAFVARLRQLRRAFASERDTT